MTVLPWSKTAPAKKSAVESPLVLSVGVRLRNTPWPRRIRWTAIATAFVAVVWFGLLEERLIARRWGVVLPGRLYRSGQVSRFLVEDMLRNHRIATVIDLNGFNRHNANQQVELAVAEYLEIDHHRFALAGDGTGSLDKYADAVALIALREQEGKTTLVHCGAGSNRTGGVIAAYRLLVRNEPVERVQAELEAFDCTARSNPKLVPFLNANLPAIAQKLVERGTIARVPDTMPQLAE